MESSTKPNIQDIQEAYENASGTWTGCDWATSHGTTCLDLDGCNSSHVRDAADRIERGEDTGDDAPQPSEDLGLDNWIADLRSGADYLARVEISAAAAESYAHAALQAAYREDWGSAIESAQLACEEESRYGDCPTWRAFRDALCG